MSDRRAPIRPTSPCRGRITVLTTYPQRAGRMVATLSEVGYEVQVVRTTDRVSAPIDETVDALLLDVTGAHQGALTALERYLDQTQVPLIAFTTSTDAHSGVAAIDVGADDLLTARMLPQELVARVRAVLRRKPRRDPQSTGTMLTAGPVTVDRSRGRVEVNARIVFLTTLELKLLSYLLEHPEEPITRERLLGAVWGYSGGGTATVTVHVRRLREKIEEDPANPTLIRTVWGVGYCFSPTGT